MKTENIKSARNKMVNQKDFTNMYYTRVMQVKMLVAPLNNLTAEEILNGLNDGKFEIMDHEFIVIAETINDDEPKVVGLVERLDTYHGEVKEKDFKLTE